MISDWFRPSFFVSRSGEGEKERGQDAWPAPSPLFFPELLTQAPRRMVPGELLLTVNPASRLPAHRLALEEPSTASLPVGTPGFGLFPPRAPGLPHQPPPKATNKAAVSCSRSAWA
jgi:hypothetical protein